jgi:hypothetical protein
MLDLNSSVLNAKGKIAWANDTGGAGIHLQLPEWQEYAQQWRSLSKRSVFAVPVGPPATSATLTSAPEQLQTVGDADDEHVVTQLRACYLRSVEADLEAKLVRRVRIKYLAAITLAGLFCGGTVWLLRGRSPLFGSAITATRSPAASPQPPAAAVSLPVVDAQSRGSILRTTTRDQLRIRSKSCPLSCRPAGALRLARRSSQESRPHLLRCSDVCLTGIKTQIGRHEQRLCVANPRIAQGRRGHQDRPRSEMLLHLPFSTIVWHGTPRTNRSLAAPPSRDCPTVEGAVTKMGHRAGTALST